MHALSAWNEAERKRRWRRCWPAAARGDGLRHGGAAPIAKRGELSAAADRIWSTMEEADWMEAFACHPRIGERKAHTHQRSRCVVATGASSASNAAERVLAELAAGNALYEQRFGFTYIVCATGKSAEEMLAILNRRLAAIAQPSCARRRSSSGRLRRFVWESGLWNERNYNTRAGRGAGQAGAGVAVRLEKQEDSAWAL
jgi:OHCU decarboxylase